MYDEYINYHNQYSKKYGKNTLVLYQNGSFYETFSTRGQVGDNGEGPNLQEISQLLNIICTRKDKSIATIDRKNPYMLGFPLVSASKFINILIENGYTLIIVDQITPPPNPKRQITNIYSPGTFINGPQKPDYNFICSLYIEENIQKSGKYLLCIGMSAVDVTTGKCYVHEAYSAESDDKYSLDECLRFLGGINPTEIVIHFKEQEKGIKKDDLFAYLELHNRKNIHHRKETNKKYTTINFQTEFLKKVYPECGQLNPIEFLEMDKFLYATTSLIILLDFLYDHNNKIIDNLNKPDYYHDTRNVILGNNAIYQLNIVENSMGQINCKFDSLFSVVNQTSTHMGRRYLRDRLTSPMIFHNELNNIYNCTDELKTGKLYLEIESILKEIVDIERLEHKIPLGYLHPYELVMIIQSYEQIVKLIAQINKTKFCKNYLPKENFIKQLDNFKNEFDNTFKIDELKKHNLTEITTNIFQKNIYKDIDNIEEQIIKANNFIDDLRDTLCEYAEDKTKTKKKAIDKDNLISIKKNERDGYYLNITKLRCNILKNNLSKVKTIDVSGTKLDVSKLVFKENNNNTKIILPDLEAKSEQILELENNIRSLNMKYYLQKLGDMYVNYNVMFKEFNKFVSTIDYFKSNAKCASMYGYSKPIIEYNKDFSFIKCKKLRHPIIERIIDYEYVPHDIEIGKELKGMLLFGLNSSGKTSSMKALGLCAIMAQAGMFVPAEQCVFSPYKSIYTRITGNDNLFKGLSSFTLEMLELKAILKRAGPNTLVIGDEVCRGTEHISGNAIVASTIISLAKLNASFIFATHLHEIAQMSRIKDIKTVKPYHLSVSYDPKTDSLIYDRQLKEGPGESIYGITVAKYIIQDKEFVDMALDIKNELLKDYGSMISGKKSKYNSEVLIHECQICHNKDVKGFTSNLQTHHINFQKDCEDGLVKNKKHIRKNDKANLIVLCVECHEKVHHDEINIEGTVQTSKGKLIKVKSKTNSKSTL